MAKPMYVYTGSAWVPVATEDASQSDYLKIVDSQPSFRNLIINGDMQIAQRGTSSTGITSGGYLTADRWTFLINTQGTWTQTVENDAPTGSGFRKSLKMLCTTADASPATGDYVFIDQYFEGQNCQQIRKGTGSAQPLTLTFWVKANKTGTYIASIRDADNNRSVSASYTISTSGTWEKKTITFPADSTGALDNDNALSLYVRFWMGAGSSYTSGTLETTWASSTNANLAVGQVNLADTINNYIQFTGVQLEVGPIATPFEFLPADVELAQCQRYYQIIRGLGSAGARTSTDIEGNISFITTMRTSPSASLSAAFQAYDLYGNGYTQSSAAITIGVVSFHTNHSAGIGLTNFSGLNQGRVMWAANGGNILLSAEL